MFLFAQKCPAWVGVLVVAAVVFGAAASSAKAPARSGMGAPYKVADNLYVIPGAGANTAVFVADAGVVVVDPKYPDNGAALLDAIRLLTSKPILFAISTHGHNDHFGGIMAMASEVEVVVQENTAINIYRLRQTRDPLSLEGHPVRAFRNRLTLLEGRDAIDLYYFGPAHTDGDAFIVFREAGVMMAGDVFSNKVAPVMNLDWGGSPRDYATTMERAVTGITGVTRVISGHGPVLAWQEFVNYAEFNRRLLTHVEGAIASGRSWSEAQKSLVLPPKFAEYVLDKLDETLQDMFKGLILRSPSARP
jgi:glyoxylase-like metal-dependent hydrolase (beta-lactamase superfamily II)